MKPRAEPGHPLRLVLVGHVDHGKSTLIGRLLFETDTLPEGKLEEIQRVSAKRGMPLEWSFALDAFQAERDQAVTIDTTEIRVGTPRRDYVIIDAPGHQEFLKSMVTGAARADAAILVVDAEEGVREQTRRHAYLLHLLGIDQVVVAVNKMDLIGCEQGGFAEIAEAATALLGRVGIGATAILPVIARDGDNLVTRSARMPWYQGEVLAEVLDRLTPQRSLAERPLRFPVQDVYKFDERRIIVGRVEAGSLRVGDTLLFSPSNRTARVASIEAWPMAGPSLAQAGQSIGITLDQPIFVERGDLASDESHPPPLASTLRLNLLWLGRHPLSIGDRLRLKLATREAGVMVEAIEHVLDAETLAPVPAGKLLRDQVGVVRLRAREIIAFDAHDPSAATARCVLIDGHDTVGAGVVDQRAAEAAPAARKGVRELFSVAHLLGAEARAERNGHAGAVIWLTGLSGSGKSTLAMQVERELFARGYNVYVLDGDNVRRGLNADLGFEPKDRAENIRRVGEVAGLFADAGIVVITAFISPYRADRDTARGVAPGLFHEVYVKADLATCERRDPKGLYRRARAGEIAEFTGISAPYEAPSRPDIVVDTAARPVEACVDQLVHYILTRTRKGSASAQDGAGSRMVND